MTLPSRITSETMLGNGMTRSFPFTFRAWDGELKVITTDPDGNDADMTALSAILVYPYEDEGSQAGGTVIYPAASASAPLPEGWKITVMRDMNLLQNERLVNASRFDPVVVEKALDRLTATDQQLAEKAARAVTLPVGSEQTPEELLGSIYATRDKAARSASSAAGNATAAAGSAAVAQAARAGAEAAAAEAAGSATLAGESAEVSESWAHKAEETVSSGIPDATETLRGGGYLATQAEAESGRTSPDRPPGVAVLMTPERVYQAARPKKRFSVETLLLYVRKDGSDDNSGTEDSAAGACLTVNGALNKIYDYDLHGRDVELWIHAGTYIESVAVHSGLSSSGLASLSIQGMPGEIAVLKAPEACPALLSCTCGFGVQVHLHNLTLQGNGTTASTLLSVWRAYVQVRSLYFNTNLASSATVGDFAISISMGILNGGVESILSFEGKAHGFIYCTYGGRANLAYSTINFINMPHVDVNGSSRGFSAVYGMACLLANNITFNGSFVGCRYLVDANGIIRVGGAGENYFPGTTAGVAKIAEGAIYA